MGIILTALDPESRAVKSETLAEIDLIELFEDGKIEEEIA